MLLELEIRDLAIFASAKAELGSGLTCLTGETGSGKSVFLSALRLLQGARADADLVRRECDKAVVTARFSLGEPDPRLKTLLSEIGAEPEDDELLISREVGAQGRSRVRIGGVSASLKDLAAISRRLFDLHGQHAEQRLLAQTDHAKLLTVLAAKPDLVTAYADAWAAWKALAQKAKKAREQADEAAGNREFLEFQSKELVEAQLKPAEEDELEKRLLILSQAGQLSEWKAQIRQILSNSSILEKQLSQLAKFATKLANGDESMRAMETLVADARRNLTDAAILTESYKVPDAANPADLDRLNARLARIQKLKNRHKRDFDGLIELRDKLVEQLRQADDGHAEADLLDLQASQARERAREAGTALGTHQTKAARRLDDEVTRRLQDLGMAGACFRTRLEELTEPGADGIWRAVFELCPNPGEGWRDLAEVASGGEASRIMLAIEGCLADSDPVGLLVFDEVDAGLSGTVAHKVCDALKDLARGRQVVAITHLHQVAAGADHHFSIAKHQHEGRTVSQVQTLDRPARVLEISRMLGRPDDAAVRAHAESLLEGTK
jgi:DNA repair protein RecN (Recombination protein N)